MSLSDDQRLHLRTESSQIDSSSKQDCITDSKVESESELTGTPESLAALSRPKKQVSKTFALDFVSRRNPHEVNKVADAINVKGRIR